MPIADVITRFPVPEAATAQKIDSSDDQHTVVHKLSTAGVLEVHVSPFGLVMIRFVSESATATKTDNSGAQQTDSQE